MSVESDYYAFMAFDPEHNRRVLRYYTQFFPKGPVLDLGCGTGTFLGLLAEDGVAARGVDVDEGMVRLARDDGHEVALDDAVDHLRSLPDDSLHGVFAAHFLEHLPAPTVQAVYEQAYRVLAAGGTFVAAVPNAACLSVLGHDFWRDPTHVRFYDPLALQFFAHEAGFKVVASGENPFNHPGSPPELWPQPIDKLPNLRENVNRAIQRAIALDPDDGEEAEHEQTVTHEQVWGEIGNLLAQLDERLDTTQRNLRELHASYTNLLRQLYPANEVYVAVAVPEGTE
ncbi:MAG TPA: class I SAM-dependent methyltransferase [Jatrophihabitantaceae bacterium]|jgi:SAM-dependent methyltransferase